MGEGQSPFSLPPIPGEIQMLAFRFIVLKAKSSSKLTRTSPNEMGAANCTIQKEEPFFAKRLCRVPRSCRSSIKERSRYIGSVNLLTMTRAKRQDVSRLQRWRGEIPRKDGLPNTSQMKLHNRRRRRLRLPRPLSWNIRQDCSRSRLPLPVPLLVSMSGGKLHA